MSNGLIWLFKFGELVALGEGEGVGMGLVNPDASAVQSRII
jgi:hypothetical protein